MARIDCKEGSNNLCSGFRSPDKCPHKGVYNKNSNACVECTEDAVSAMEEVDESWSEFMDRAKNNGVSPTTQEEIDKEAAIKAWNARADGWISVETRLPDAKQRVLIYSPEQSENNIEYRLVPGSLMKAMSEATHWMPLPKPPSHS